jgi:hypothetical protein
VHMLPYAANHAMLAVFLIGLIMSFEPRLFQIDLFIRP